MLIYSNHLLKFENHEKKETELERVENLKKSASKELARLIRILAKDSGLSYNAIQRCTSVGSKTLTGRYPNPELHTATKILAYLLQTADTYLRIQVISRAIIRSQREGKNIAIRLYEPDAPLYEDEDILLMHRPKRFATSRKHQCLRNMAKRKKRHSKNNL